MRRIAPPPGTLILAAACLCLAWLLGSHAPHPGTAAPSVQAGAAPNAPGTEDEVRPRGAVDAEGLALITDRPVFSETRRPFEPVPQAAPIAPEPEPEPEAVIELVAATPAPPVQRPALRLSGVLILADRMAALVSLGGEEPVWLPLGGEIGDWTLIDIWTDEITVKGVGGEYRVGLYGER